MAEATAHCGRCAAPTPLRRKWCDGCRDIVRRQRDQQRNRSRRRDPNERREAQRRYRARKTARDRRLLSPVALSPTRKDIPPEFHPTRDDLPVEQKCRWCHLGFFWPIKKKYCSRKCSDYSIPGRRPLASDVQFGHCRRCGDVYCVSVLRASGFCSTACLTRHRRSVRKRERRKFKKAGDGYTLREIAERDGWRCHLCFRRVPDRRYAARDDDPTIDHLVPVSHGGDDVRENVALAHNRCNWERGNAGLAQLRLVG